MRRLLLALALAGCGGGAPLMHPAHPLKPGEVAVAAGFSGQVVVEPGALAGVSAEPALEEGAVSPGLAPFVAGRLGIYENFEGGLAYTGRSARADARYVLDFEETALSFGLAATAVLPKRRGDLEELRAAGFGGELPIVYGYRSRGDVYGIWIGARGGFERLEGHLELPFDPSLPDAPLTRPFQAWHGWAGGLLGFRVGFRHVHAALELDAAYHFVDGELGASSATLHQFTLAPAGAIMIKF